MGQELLTIKQAAERVGAHKVQVYRLITSGFIPSYEENGVKKVKASEFLRKWEERPQRESQPRMSRIKKTKIEDKPPKNEAKDRTGPTPNFNEERAWTEYERNRALKLENDKNEGILVYREDMERAFQSVLSTMVTKGYEVSKQIKQRIPSITHEEMEVIEKLVLDVFEQVSEDEFEELEEVEND